MPLYGLGGFLDKFSQLLNNEFAQKEIIQEVIKDHFGLLLERKNISLKNGIITISGSPALRQRIYMEKSKIVEELQQKLPAGNIKDIR